MLTIVSATAFLPKAQGAARSYIFIDPSIGPPGTVVRVTGVWFNQGWDVTISFGSTVVASSQVSLSMGGISASFIVPSVPTGSYVVSAVGGAADHASTSFLVTTSSSTSTVAPFPSGSASTGGQTQPQNSPAGTDWVVPPYYSSQSPGASNAGFWSTPIIIVVAVAVAAASLVSVTLLLRRRGDKALLIKEEPPQYPPAPIYASRTPAAASQSRKPTYGNQPFSASAYSSRYSQPARSYGQNLSRPPITPPPSQPSRYSQPSSSTKVCPRCKNAIRADYNICPHCNKKLR
jgi:hypothetical protein